MIETKNIVSHTKENGCIIFHKRIAVIISLLLCIALYLLFLNTAFTQTRTTYVCYTTKTGTHYHAPTCRYINTAYETTVYEACRKYKPCEYCNPCMAEYKTKFTERNYIAPLAISIPVSVAVFFLLSYRKERI